MGNSVKPQPDLTAKQARFVEEYLIDLNATAGAIRAGYSGKTAATIAHENLRKPKIAEAIRGGPGEALQTRSDHAGGRSGGLTARGRPPTAREARTRPA